MNPFKSIPFLKRLVSLLQAYLAFPDSSARNKLYLMAVLSLGRDASPNDIAPDEYGCAETVNAIHKKAFGFEIGGDISTCRLYQAIQKSKFFIKVDQPLEGDVIISPSGMGNGNLPNGHTGIMGKNGVIMSNSSATGLWTENYTLETWRNRYAVKGGYPVLVFRRI